MFHSVIYGIDIDGMKVEMSTSASRKKGEDGDAHRNHVDSVVKGSHIERRLHPESPCHLRTKRNCAKRTEASKSASS